MKKCILIGIALFCLACAGIEPAPQQISSKSFDTSGCDYLYNSPAELAAAVDNETDNQEHSGVVCHVDADNATFTKTNYEYGKIYEWQRVYNAYGTISSVTRFYNSDTLLTTSIFTKDGAELLRIAYDNDGANMPQKYGSSCGDGRELEPAEIISWIRGEELNCGIGEKTIYRNIGTNRCEYTIDDVRLVDGLVVSKAKSKPITGTVCAMHDFDYQIYYYETSFAGGVPHGSAKTYSNDTLFSDLVYQNGELVKPVEEQAK
jgi:hypothetical protein